MGSHSPGASLPKHNLGSSCIPVLKSNSRNCSLTSPFQARSSRGWHALLEPSCQSPLTLPIFMNSPFIKLSLDIRFECVICLFVGPWLKNPSTYLEYSLVHRKCLKAFVVFIVIISNSSQLVWSILGYEIAQCHIYLSSPSPIPFSGGDKYNILSCTDVEKTNMFSFVWITEIAP